MLLLSCKRRFSILLCKSPALPRAVQPGQMYSNFADAAAVVGPALTGMCVWPNLALPRRHMHGCLLGTLDGGSKGLPGQQGRVTCPALSFTPCCWNRVEMEFVGFKPPAYTRSNLIEWSCIKVLLRTCCAHQLLPRCRYYIMLMARSMRHTMVRDTPLHGAPHVTCSSSVLPLTYRLPADLSWVPAVMQTSSTTVSMPGRRMAGSASPPS